tara:strand:+ start:1256 stop:1504 length:249 start_codon:yes stop_codon:yes gene_type:complete
MKINTLMKKMKFLLLSIIVLLNITSSIAQDSSSVYKGLETKKFYAVAMMLKDAGIPKRKKTRFVLSISQDDKVVKRVTLNVN